MSTFKFQSDFLRLSTEPKPTGENIDDGSTLYEVDTMKFYVFYKNNWYLQEEQ